MVLQLKGTLTPVFTTTPLLGDLPSSTDLSGSFPTPGNQGAQASCVGWAVAYALKSFQEHTERKWSLSDNDHLLSPAYIYNQINRSGSCSAGTTFTDALNLLRREGVATISNFPYTDASCSAIPDAAIKQSARPFLIADWRRVNVQDEVEVKTQVASHFPVLIGMMVDEAFSRLRSGQVYSQPSGTKLGGHAMVVVGYDDSRKAFKVINSWGQQWGDGGYAWIAYDTFRATVREAYVAQDIIVPVHPSPTPIPNPAPVPSPLVITTVEASGIPTFWHNQVVASPTGPQQGLRISAPVLIQNGQGKTVQVIAKFSHLNGPALLANPAETIFRDVGGLVAIGSAPRIIGSNREFLADQLSIPYYALNFQGTNFNANYNLTFTVFVYIDNQLAYQTPPVAFPFRW